VRSSFPHAGETLPQNRVVTLSLGQKQ